MEAKKFAKKFSRVKSRFWYVVLIIRNVLLLYMQVSNQEEYSMILFDVAGWLYHSFLTDWGIHIKKVRYITWLFHIYSIYLLHI